MLTAPVKPFSHFCLIRKFHAFHDPLIEFIEAGAVHDISYVLLGFKSVRIDVFLNIGIAVSDHLKDAFFIGPLDEVFSESGILLACAALENDSEVTFFAPGPCAGWAVGDADSAADA